MQSEALTFQLILQMNEYYSEEILFVTATAAKQIAKYYVMEMLGSRKP